jgi:hypothetical protein
MRLHRIAFTLAAFCLCQAPSVSLADTSFPEVVSEILNGQTEGRISEMGAQQKSQMIDCVNKVLTDLPAGQKRHVLEGSDFEDREHRFGKIVQENHAEWKKKIASACAEIAMEEESS